MDRTEFNEAVFSPRFLEKLRSGIGLRADTRVETLVKFESDEALERFLAQQDDATPDQPALEVERVARSIRVVTLELRLDTLAALSVEAEDLGIQSIDENFRVHMFLDETREVEKVQAAWTAGFHGEGIKVAVLDTGIDGTHPDLQNVVTLSENFTDEGEGDRVGHGTHVASIVAGRGVADATKKGVADACTLLDGKVLASDGFGTASDTIAAIEWAAEQEADIINMSLGASGHFDGTDPLSEAADWAVDQGIIVCAAAGNCGPEGNPLACPARGDKTINTPGCAGNVITVGAVDKAVDVAGYSSRGPTWGNLIKPDVVTVGSGVVAARARDTDMGTPVNDRYTRASGTSMATPVCAGLVALLLEASRERGGQLTPDQLKELLKDSAIPLDGVPETVQGSGFVNMESALSALGDQPTSTVEVVSFSPENGKPHRAREQRNWFLVLRNTGEQPLYNVEATFSPGQVALEPATEAFGTMEGSESERAGYLVGADTAGRFQLELSVTYQTALQGSVTREEFEIPVEIKPTVEGLTQEKIDAVVDDAVRRLMLLQNTDGTWAGGIMFNAWTNGMYCILHRVMGLPGEPTRALDWIEDHQSGQDVRGDPNDTWGIVDDPSLNFLEATVVAEIALEIWGRGRRQEAWDFIDQQATGRLASAISLTDPFTQMFSALASDYAPPGTPPYYAVSDILAPPLELLLVPRFMEASLPHLFGAWGQDAVLGLMLMATMASGQRIPLTKQILLRKAESQLLRSQNEDGSWYDTILPSMAATMGMYLFGYDLHHPVMQKAVGFLQRLERADGYVARYRLPVWDTSIAIIALRSAGVSSQNPALRRAGHYLMNSQNEVDGGIPFQLENVPYPDTDDTCFAALALNELDMAESEPEKQTTIARGLRWLLYMQGDDGGWAAFAKNQAKPIRGRIPIFKDDPPTADVTGHVISGLKLASSVGEVEAANDAIERGIAWLQRMQMDRGEWFGRWGLTYTYGTTAVLQGLYDTGQPMNQDFVHRGVNYLLQTQQEDGGWGEGYATYYNFAAQETQPSTVEQTAWSVLGLLVAPQTASVREAIDRGVTFLLDRYDPEKGWPEGQYTVGALWIYKNTVYPLLWGIWALSLYRKLRGG